MNAHMGHAAPAAEVPGIREAEEAVRAIWLDVLGDEAPEEIGLDDDFFEIGGTSLSMVAVIAKMSMQFGTDLPTSIVVNGATIQALTSSALRHVEAKAS